MKSSAWLPLLKSNMQQITTQAIVLSRTNFGEADRIVTFLTPGYGKVSTIVKGARKARSKLAGGIELFSVSDISFITGRGELSIVTSTRLLRHYAHVVKDLDRTNLGYELIKSLNKATEDSPEPEYFKLLDEALAALDDKIIDLEIIKVWFAAQLLRLAGHTPNLQTDGQGGKLEAAKSYSFNFDTMGFFESRAGRSSYGADQIKFLRLIFAGNSPKYLQNIKNAPELARQVSSLLSTMNQA